MDNFLSFVIYWGVWLIVPIFIDGLTTLLSLFAVVVGRIRQFVSKSLALEFFPVVSIIVPVYNSEKTLEACLRSISEQDYPRERIEIFLINNGSSDSSFDVFAHVQEEQKLSLSWHSIINKGKAWALNAGIHLAHGKFIFNIDSDVVLAPDAIRRVVEAMEADPNLGAVTGAVQVLSPPEEASPLQRILAECEFFEYLTAFHVGREYQALLRNLYTLSGAFSIFRREVLIRTFLYSQETVSEDTDLTFEIYERFPEYRVGFVHNAVAYVHPVESLGALYSQRVRWQRGQVEVSARHERLMRRPVWQLFRFAPARVLAIDHTLAFPRIVWTFLLPVLVLFGYSLSQILMAQLFIYGFYLLIDLAWIGVAWTGTNAAAQSRLYRFWWLLPLMPLYRMIIFWFRFSGFLNAVAEPGTWRVQDPIDQIVNGLHELRQSALSVIRSIWHPFGGVKIPDKFK